MNGVLPDASMPWVTLQLNGLSYRYTMTKDPNSDAVVWVRNKDTIGGGYVFEEKDDWSGAPGGVIQKYYRFPYSDSTRWGDGSVSVDGQGEVSDVTLTYNYRMDVDEELMLCTTTPLADPTCPGFSAALQDLLNRVEVSPDDPFYDEWVQANLSLNDQVEEDKQEQSEEPEERLSNFEKDLGGDNTIEQLSNQDQNAIIEQIGQAPKIEPYYILEIPGGQYNDVLVLSDPGIVDNRRALRNLASDNKHKTMVRSQYDREQ